MKKSIVLLLIPCLLLACKDKNESQSPSVITYGYELTNDTVYSCVGYVTSDGNSDISDRGICYCQNSSSVIDMSRATRISAGAGSGEFRVTLPSLRKGVEYIYCAYATNAMGTTFGQTKTILRPADISTARSLNDFLGTYNATVYNKGVATYETWSNVQIVRNTDGTIYVTNLGTKNQPTWPVLNITAVGRYDDLYKCILLNDTQYNTTTNVFAISTSSGSIVCAALFTPVCEIIQGSQRILQRLYYDNNMGEVALCKQADGGLVLKPSPYREAYGRKYELFTFVLYDYSSWNVVTNVSAYSDFVLRRSI